MTPGILVPATPRAGSIVLPAGVKLRKNHPRTADFLWVIEHALPLVPVPCPVCGGTGSLPAYAEVFPRRRWWTHGLRCPSCKGRGRL